MNENQRHKPSLIITGSSGLIGSRLVEAFSNDYRIACLDINPPETEIAGATWFECDMTEDDAVERALANVREELGSDIASVIHLAAYYDFSGESSPLYRDLTVEGTVRLLKSLQNFNVEQFVFSSSLLVMKSSDQGEPINAFSPIDAEWDYPQSKLAAERAIRDHRGSIPTVVLRIAGVYDEYCHSLPIAQQIKRIHEKQLESYFFPGDKSHGQAFIHLDDLVSCFSQVVAKRHVLPAHEVFVIGEDDVMSYDELQEALGKYIHGKEWPAIRIPKMAAKAGAWFKDRMANDEDAPFIKPWMIDLADQNYPVDIQRAQKLLDWQPNHRLRETLPQMMDKLYHDMEKWYEINKLPAPDFVQDEQPNSTGAGGQ